MNILVVAAHPDDEVLGCGGTVARLIREGHKASVVILGEGITSRAIRRNRSGDKRELLMLKIQAVKANKILGISKIFTFDFPDNRFDTVSFLDIVKAVEDVKRKVSPDIVFTHNANDLNIDHQITFRAVLTAFRPLPKERTKAIYSFEVLSSTEWGYPNDFCPTVFFDISKTIKLKIKAIKEYKGEMRAYPHPRSVSGIEISARSWGMNAGLKYAEAFSLVRMIK